jgi:DNA-binding NarL/FixJ family response regulator
MQSLQEMKAINPAGKLLSARGYTNNETIRNVPEVGALVLIGKPFDAHGLSKKISSVLQGRQFRRSNGRRLDDELITLRSDEFEDELHSW